MPDRAFERIEQRHADPRLECANEARETGAAENDDLGTVDVGRRVGLRRQFLWDFCRKARSNPVVELQGTGAETRDFIYGTDICQAVSCISEQAPLAGEAVNICSGEQTSIAGLAALLASEFTAPLDVRFSGERPEGVPLQWQGDATALAALGFRPAVALADGVRRTVEWFRSLP
jgi:UDP-glucose 4-epimerase